MSFSSYADASQLYIDIRKPGGEPGFERSVSVLRERNTHSVEPWPPSSTAETPARSPAERVNSSLLFLLELFFRPDEYNREDRPEGQIE